MYADIIIKNGRCVTMCGDGGADWVAAAGKMICAAGRGDDWQKLVRPGTQVIDARGGTVLPGFIDNHFHVMQTAVNMMSVDLGGARSHRELGEMLAAAEKREGAVLGCQVEESQFEEKRFAAGGPPPASIAGIAAAGFRHTAFCAHRRAR